MRVKGDGKVGIGTAAPTTLLEVNESTDNTAIVRIDSSETADDTPASALDLFASSSTAGADKKHFRFTNINDANSAGQNQLQFQSRDDDGSYDATLMVIEHDGNVGIGTTSPDVLLHMSASADLRLTLQSAGSGDGSILFKNTSASNRSSKLIFEDSGGQHGQFRYNYQRNPNIVIF